VNQSGGSTLPANDTTGWAGEETLDVEAAHSVCQGCKIDLIEANSESNADLAAAENEAVALNATVISNSFGASESTNDASFQAAFNHPGVVIVAATGDDGYYSYDQLTGTNAPDIPASYSTVVAAGGTSLFLGQTGARQSETTWNDNGIQDFYSLSFGLALGAGGGGCSTMFAAPRWQTHLSVWGSTACGAERLDADVASVADPLTGFDIYLSYNCGGLCSTGWQTVGGTSLSSPVIAAAYALAGGAQGMPYPALTLYGRPGGAYDVTSGGNGWCDGQGAAQCGDPNSLGFGVVDCDYPASGSIASAGDRACDALPGYDGATGWGTPKGLLEFRPVNFGVISRPASVTHGVAATFGASKSVDPYPGGSIATYTWNWGDGTAPSSGVSSAHTYASAGTYTLTLVITDSYGARSVNSVSVVVS
jgi:hypothetical protein